MRPGSCPRQPLSPSVPSRSVRQAIAAALPIVLALILLPPLAFASPPDPSWVAGFYDGADGDDVVSLVYETSAANQVAPSHLGPLPCLLDMNLDGIVRNVPHCHFTRGSRSPPVIRSPKFVSIFNSLPPPPSFTEAPFTLGSLLSDAADSRHGGRSHVNRSPGNPGPCNQVSQIWEVAPWVDRSDLELGVGSLSSFLTC